jgi:predicted TIM-barrel fold metal-dependent hydrolase
LDFLDTHQHLIYRQRFGYGWTSGAPALAQGDFTTADYRGLTAGLGISGTLFMETAVDDTQYQDEARFVAGLIGQDKLLGQIASCRPEADGFDDWLEECGSLGVVGLRRILHVMPDDLSRDAAFRRNIRALGAKNLCFDMCFQARQLPIALELAQACDAQILVLDHCGVPDIAGGGFSDWASDMTALAALPHVHVKLSGIVAYANPGTPDLYATLRPWVDHVIAAFGPQRMLWGSDWPVVNLGTELPDWIDLTRRLIGGLSDAEQAEIASGTARRCYRV